MVLAEPIQYLAAPPTTMVEVEEEGVEVAVVAAKVITVAGARLNRKVFIPAPPRCSTPGAAASGSGGGLDDADEELDDDLDDVMGDEDMDDDEIIARPFQQQGQQQVCVATSLTYLPRD